MKTKIWGIVMGTLSLWNASASAHGMDKHGPHGGYIQMPGAFHTELVPKDETSFGVYLLDVEFKNPVVSKSTLSGYLKRNETKTDVTCAQKPDHFLCELPAGWKMQKGDRILLKANRQGMTGGLSVYSIPLKLLRPGAG